MMFEYLTISRHQAHTAGDKAEVEMLNYYGTKGWEMVAVRTVNSGEGVGQMVDLYYFKRALQSPQASP